MPLTDLITQVEGLLADAGNVKWSDAEITNGLRLAMSEASLNAGELLTLTGLDSAPATTLPALVEGILALGGAAYCAVQRVAAWADWESESLESAQLQGWGEARLQDFRTLLRQAYPAETTRVRDQRRSTAPFAAWTDDFGEQGKDELG
jgi:hypothetical protein